jgi:hypothetical protein
MPMPAHHSIATHSAATVLATYPRDHRNSITPKVSHATCFLPPLSYSTTSESRKLRLTHSTHSFISLVGHRLYNTSGQGPSSCKLAVTQQPLIVKILLTICSLQGLYFHYNSIVEHADCVLQTVK